MLKQAHLSLHGSTNLHSILYTYLTTSQESFLKSKTGIWTATNFQERASMAIPVIYGYDCSIWQKHLKGQRFILLGLSSVHGCWNVRRSSFTSQQMLLMCGPISKAYQNSAGRTRVQSTSLWVGVHFRFKLTIFQV